MPITELFLNNDTQSSYSPKFGANPRVPIKKIKNKAGKLINSFNSTEASIDDNIKWIVNIPSITKNSKSITNTLIIRINNFIINLISKK